MISTFLTVTISKSEKSVETITATELHATSKTVGRAMYSAPYLKVFGSVNGLTMSGAGTRCDGAGSPGNTYAKNGGGNCGAQPSTSDRSLKENIVRVGTHPMGFGMYLFDYKPEFRSIGGYDRQFGVMADEVKSVLPEAVVTHPDGYMMVDYALLGISRAVH